MLGSCPEGTTRTLGGDGRSAKWACMPLRWNCTRRPQKIHVRCSQYPSLHPAVNQEMQRGYLVEFLSPTAHLKDFEAANSSSVGPDCFRLRAVRFLGRPRSGRLRRGLVVRGVAMRLGSDKSQIDPVLHLRSATATTQGSRMCCTLNLFFSLNSHLPK